MICLGRDGRKEVGLGFGGGREMDDTELEEGEASSYHNNSNNNNVDYDASVDPDIALSYIGEKLQNVLGHFQKDFEGGVSAENLGAKFGGYGSFLPTYQRSPVLSHPRTPPRIQQYNDPRSPNDLQLEGGQRNSVSSLTAPQSLPLETGSISGVSDPVLRASSSLIGSVKQEVCMPPIHYTEDVAPISKYVNKNSANLPDQKMLKVRIKMGSDNLSTQKNAAIYSGLGLDVSPSSSLDDIHELQDTPSDSPADILRIMISFPLPGGLLLSPLSDDLLHLTDKENLPKDIGSFPAPRVLENSRIIVSGSDSIKGDRKISGEKNAKSRERNEISTEKSDNDKDISSGVDVISKETDLETFACEELVSPSLKFPLLANSYSAPCDMGKGMGRTPKMSKEVKKGMAGDKDFSDLTKEDRLMAFTQEDGLNEGNKASSARKVREDKKPSSIDSFSVYPRKESHLKGENSELTDLPKNKAHLKATSHEQEGIELPSGKESSSSEGKKKVKGSQGKAKVAAAEIPKESSRASSSSMSKTKNGIYVDNHAMKGELEDLKSLKNTVKARDRYTEFFGDMELEQEENEKSPEMSYEDRLKDSDGIEKSTHFTSNVSRERSNGKMIDKLSPSEAYPKATSSVTPPSSKNGPVPDVDPAATAPVVMEDNWVCCDKCQKWRLLPFGKNPNDLPEKWLCSMLNWLLGMNRCSFSEEETTNALRALYQVPAPESQISLQSNLGGIIRQANQSSQTFGLPVLPTGGKKKHGLKEISDAYKDGTTQLSNSMKKITEQAVNSGSLNEVKRSPMVSESDFRKLSKSNDAVLEKNKHRQKEKHKILDNCSDEADNMRSKIKGKRDADQDFSKASKKTKTEGLSENWMDHGEPSEKVGPSLSNGLPTVASGKNLPNYSDHTSKDFKLNQKDQVQVSAKKSKDKVRVSLDDRPMEAEKYNNGDVLKKRKMKETHDAPGSVSITGHQLQENHYRKEKKAKVSRFEGKESSANKGNGRTDKKGSHRKSQHVGKQIGSTVSRQNLDGMDSFKRDSGSLHPTATATSSSSKVSGSNKSKSNVHETKGSPVDSISSSPMRVLKAENFTSARRNLTEKDESPNLGYFVLGCLRRSSDGEDDGGRGRSATARKEKALDVLHNGPIQSSMLDFQEKNFSHASVGKAKLQNVPSPDITNRHFTYGSVDYLGQDTPCASKKISDQCQDNERQNESHYNANGSSAKKSVMESSSWSKEKNRKSNSESDSSRAKASNTSNEQTPSNEAKPMSEEKRTAEKIGITLGDNEKKYINKQDCRGLLSNESGKRESRSKIGNCSAPNVKVDALGQDATLPAKQNMDLDCEVVSGREKSLSLPSGGSQNDAIVHCPQPVSELCRRNGANSLIINASDADNLLMVQKKNSVVDHLNGIHHSTSKNPTPSEQKVKDLDARSPVKRDSQAANNAVKEAKNLKHMADRLKNSGSNLESTRLYFEAALKFLHGASLLETCGNENAKTGEMIQSMQMYSSTAKLCEFCAHEYEKSKDTAAAALAYKCMEVAYMRVIYSSHTNANRDRHELQKALQMIPPGESPSSSASDIDNLNHLTAVDKVPLVKSITSPQVTGNHVIAARNRPNFIRLLNFAQNINFAMEASRKSWIAFAAANLSLGEAQRRDGIPSIKMALDFNFHDVEGLLRLVRLAIEAISR